MVNVQSIEHYPLISYQVRFTLTERLTKVNTGGSANETSVRLKPIGKSPRTTKLRFAPASLDMKPRKIIAPRCLKGHEY